MKLAFSQNQKGIILVFRWLQILTVTILISTSSAGISLGSPGYSLALFFFLSNFILFIIPRNQFDRPWLPMAIFLLDVSIISTAIYLTGQFTSGFYIVYLLLIFMAAVGQDLKGTLFAAAIAAGIYTWIGLEKGFSLLETGFLIRIPFLFLVAFFSGILSQRSRLQKIERERMEQIRRDLQVRLEMATEKEELAYEKILTLYEYNENILQSIEQGVMVVDLSGKVIVFNRGAEKITGYKSREICGKPLSELKGFIKISLYLPEWKKDIGRAKDVLTEIATATHKVIPIEVSVSLLKYPQGLNTGIIVIFKELLEHQIDLGEGAKGERSSQMTFSSEEAMKKILIVEDDAHTSLLYQELLAGGYQVFVATDGLAALRRIRDEKPDLVILDIKMPGMNGIEILEKSKKYNQNLPFIICTGARLLKDDPDLKSSNVKAFFEKPFIAHDLKSEVDQLLQ
ncbi:response regulator [candidate division TA06 bacterium]|nr:response regulator [candidate division TA06 bacterium]